MNLLSKKIILGLLLLLPAALHGQSAKIYQANPVAKNVVTAKSCKLPEQQKGIICKQEKTHGVPWTSKPILNNSENFHFAIVSDRTAGPRDNVFSNAMHQINLLQPDFVMSVGDLIEGTNSHLESLNKEYDGMDSFLNILNMRFFRVPGNHDIGNSIMMKVYKQRYGSPYYHFVYQNVLFLIISTEDPPVSTISDEQVEYIKKVLQNNKNVRWTFVFMHEPLFLKNYKAKNQNWNKIEKMLNNRSFSLFVGHYHGYQKYVRNGHNYIILAPTGGACALTGIKDGSFDGIAWVTMTEKEPIIAVIALKGLLNDDLKGAPVTSEASKKKEIY
ncbi:metallophosphoesterase [bacterium]|nr:metallophosphoesterase [bacterium]